MPPVERPAWWTPPVDDSAESTGVTANRSTKDMQDLLAIQQARAANEALARANAPVPTQAKSAFSSDTATGEIASYADTSRQAMTPPQPGVTGPVLAPTDPTGAPVYTGKALGPGAISSPEQATGQSSYVPPPEDTSAAGLEKQMDKLGTAYDAKTREATQLAFKATQDQSDRLVAAQEEATRRKDEATAAFQKSREMAHQAADAETASWLQKQSDLSKQEPNRGRYWENQSGFGKALWLVSVGLQAFANSKSPGAPNHILDMLMHEVEADTSSQKDRLERQREDMKTRGGLMQKNQDRRLHDMEDDDARTFQRLEAVRNTLLERAKRPGSAEEAAVMAGMDQAIMQRGMSVVSARRDKAYQIEEKKADRAHAYGMQAQAHSYKAADDERDRRWAVEDTNKKYEHDREMAQVSFDSAQRAAVAGARAAGQSELDKRAASEEAIPLASGWRAVTPPNTNAGLISKLTGQAGAKAKEIRVPKEVYKEAGAMASGYTETMNGLSDLKKAVLGASDAGYFLNSDEDLASRVIEVGARYAKTLNGGRGPLNEGDQGRGEKALMGVDMGSFISKLKGASREDRARMIDERMRKLPAEATSAMTTQFGSRLGGATIEWDPTNTNPDLPTESVRAQESRYGKTEAPAPISDTKDYRERKQAGPDTMPYLPTEIKSKIEDASLAMQGGDPAHVTQVSEGALKAIEALKKTDPVRAKDAEIRLKAETEDAMKVASKYNEVLSGIVSKHVSAGFMDRGIVDRTLGRQGTPAPITFDEVKAAAAEQGVTAIDPERLRKTVKALNAALQAK